MRLATVLILLTAITALACLTSIPMAEPAPADAPRPIRHDPDSHIHPHPTGRFYSPNGEILFNRTKSHWHESPAPTPDILAICIEVMVSLGDASLDGMDDEEIIERLAQASGMSFSEIAAFFDSCREEWDALGQ